MQLKKHISEYLLLLILLLGIGLRFYHFGQLPFSWDELSAWSRLHFNSFSDLIEYGVKPDGHPAGVQVFLYYWVAIFGDQEWVVKLPFNIMGVTSIYLVYAIGEIWWSKATGLFSAAYVSSLQFFVLYSPIARPYVSGLFLTLMMVYFWSYYMFKIPERKYLIGYIIFAALSSYNHHFSLLFAAIVGLTGLLVVPKNVYKEYILAGILIFVLYIPHLSIFFHQLGIGGIGGKGNWLTKPESNFVWHFLYWCFHYSYLVLGLLGILIMGALWNLKNMGKKSKTKRKEIILILWFFLPIAIGYYYSILVNPVIQYSMLIFSTPYLFLFLFCSYKKIKPAILTVLVLLILGLNTYTLIQDRQHYQIIFNQPFEGTAKTLSSQKDIQTNNIFLIHNYIPSYQGYYLDKYQLNQAKSFSIYGKDFNISQMDSLLQNISEDYVLASGLPETFIPLIAHYYPFLMERKNGYTYESYLFSRTRKPGIQLHQLIQPAAFNIQNKQWQIPASRFKHDTSGRHIFTYDSTQIWGLSFSDSLRYLCPNYGDIIDMEVEFTSLNPHMNAIWVATFSELNTANEPHEIWRGQNFQHQIIPTQDGFQCFFSLDTRLILTPKQYPQSIFKTYFWNKNKDQFQLTQIHIYRRPANPIKYALFQDFEKIK
jgi:hypothetical protein